MPCGVTRDDLELPSPSVPPPSLVPSWPSPLTSRRVRPSIILGVSPVPQGPGAEEGISVCHRRYMGADILESHASLQQRAPGLVEFLAAEMIAAYDWLARRRQEVRGQARRPQRGSRLESASSLGCKRCFCSSTEGSLLACFFSSRGRRA